MNAAYNSNPILRDDDDDPVDLSRLLAVFQMEVRENSASSRVLFQPRVTRDWYPDEDRKALQSTDIFIPGSVSYLTNRTTTTLGMNVSRQNILSNENTISETADSQNDFRADDIQYTAGLVPSFTFSLSPRDQVSIQGTAGLVDFDLDYTGRSDFKFYDIGASYRRAITPRQQVGFTAGLGRSEAEGLACREDIFLTAPFEDPCSGNIGAIGRIVNATNLNENDTTSLTVDYEFNWTENTSVVARIGRQTNDSTTTVKDFNGNTLLFEEVAPGIIAPVESFSSKNENLTYDVALRRKTERLFVEIAGQQRARPSQLGTPQDRQQIAVNARFQASRRLVSQFNFLAWEQQSVLAGDEGDLRKIRFLSAQLRADYSFTRRWSILASYAYRIREDDRPGSSRDLRGTDNEVRLGIGYTFKQLRP